MRTRPTRRLSAAVALLVALATSLAACGTSEPAAEAAETTTGTATGTTAGPVSVTDSRGKTITLDAAPTKVVALEWGLVENLITLGVMPVGVADTKGYSTWVTAEKLDPSVKDVGLRGEASVDSIVGLDPDLVLTTADESPANIEQIEKYVPVVVIAAADASNALPRMTENVTLIASAVGKQEQATKVLADWDAALAAAKDKITQAGLAGTTFTMADGWKQGSSVSIRMYTSGSLLGATGEAMGLKVGWTGEGDKAYGLAQTDVEGLTKLPADNHFLYIASDTDGGDVFAGLKGNAVWDGLAFVKAGDVHRLPDGIWMFGGPKSTEQWMDAAVAALTS